MEHVFSCAFASGCEFTTKNLKIKIKGSWQISIRKKIVCKRYVFAGPLPSALPPPPSSNIPFGCVVFTWSPWVMWTTWTTNSKSHGHAMCGQCGQSFFFCPHDPQPFFFFAWEFPARGFVDNVDNVDARFKLVADEVSTLPYTMLYIY